MMDGIPVRVMVQDAWDAVELVLPPTTLLSDLKRQALTATHVVRDPREYVLKFRGAEMGDETRTLNEAGIVPNASVIVLPRRRRPVK